LYTYHVKNSIYLCFFCRLQALIEREWIAGGFPFSSRHKNSCYTPSNLRKKNCSSTFVLFLDCVFQLHSQFPCSFEFNTTLLIVLFENSFYSQYGTFLGNSEQERASLDLMNVSVSLWTYLNIPQIMNSLLNLMYEPNSNVIWPSVAPISLVLWSDLYLRWVVEQKYMKKMFDDIQTLITKEKELRCKVLKLRRQLIDVFKEYQELESLANEEDSD
jgi:myotubularin-related protein 9